MMDTIYKNKKKFGRWECISNIIGMGQRQGYGWWINDATLNKNLVCERYIANLENILSSYSFLAWLERMFALSFYIFHNFMFLIHSNTDKNDINKNHYLRPYYPVHLQKDILQQAAFSTVLIMREEVVGVQQIICAWISRKWLAPDNSYGLDAKY